jgi:hypothetical protein
MKRAWTTLLTLAMLLATASVSWAGATWERPAPSAMGATWE